MRTLRDGYPMRVKSRAGRALTVMKRDKNFVWRRVDQAIPGNAILTKLLHHQIRGTLARDDFCAIRVSQLQFLTGPNQQASIINTITASFGFCARAHHGVTCQTVMVPLRLVTTALFAGDALESGTRSWMP
jgi:hypothetical protein